jgi:thiol-disulfide isomerase/thioredoxin
MNKAFYYLIVLLSSIEFKASAQLNIISNALSKMNSYKNISYYQTEKQKSPFNDDVTILSIKSRIANENKNGKKVINYIQEDKRGYKTILNNGNKIDLDLNSKTYTISQHSQEYPSNSPNFWLAMLHEKLLKAPEKISQLPDTTINNAICYHFKLPFSDSVSNREIYDLCLTKTGYLPLYVKQFLEGKFGKGNITSDLIAKMVTENTFSDYYLNSSSFPDISAVSIPSNFQPEKKLTLLTAGEKAPDWRLQDVAGVFYSSRKLQGKLTLIDFSFNACAACALSIPMLKRLHQKYQGMQVRILSINVVDSKESILGYIRKNSITYPILLKGSTVKKDFKLSSFPSFYLIGKQGNIISAFDGYSEDLEKNLIAQIDKSL